jgi:hypothetical protein
MLLHKSGNTNFRTSRNVRLESGMRTKATSADHYALIPLLEVCAVLGGFGKTSSAVRA